MVFVSEATPSVGTGGAGRTTPRRSQRLRSQAVVSEAAPLVAPTADADGVVVDHRHHGGEKRRLARLVGYYVAVAAGCVMGMVSAHNNARRTTLGCTAHCEASIRTLRNFLGIVSSPVSGAFSDVYGRRVALMASSVVMIVSYVVWCYATTVEVFVLYNALNGVRCLPLHRRLFLRAWSRPGCFRRRTPVLAFGHRPGKGPRACAPAAWSCVRRATRQCRCPKGARAAGALPTAPDARAPASFV